MGTQAAKKKKKAQKLLTQSNIECVGIHSPRTAIQQQVSDIFINII